MKKLFLFICAVSAGMLCAEEYKIDFSAAKPWAEIRHHAKRTEAKTQDFKGKKATVVSFIATDPKAQDTAFGLMTPQFPVAGKKEITVSASVLNPKGYEIFNGGNTYSTCIRFFDAKNKEFKKFTRIVMPKGTGEFQTISGTYPVPADAAKAQIVFGYDQPNLIKGQCFAVADVKWSTK